MVTGVEITWISCDTHWVIQNERFGSWNEHGAGITPSVVPWDITRTQIPSLYRTVGNKKYPTRTQLYAAKHTRFYADIKEFNFRHPLIRWVNVIFSQSHS